jgi:hypothetical protein
MYYMKLFSIAVFAYQVSDWLYGEGSGADAATYEAKLSELKTLTGPLYWRVKEHMERPEALAALHSMINGSSVFLANARNMTTDSPDGLFTQVELDTLEKVINETQVSDIYLFVEQESFVRYGHLVMSTPAPYLRSPRFKSWPVYF